MIKFSEMLGEIEEDLRVFCETRFDELRGGPDEQARNRCFEEYGEMHITDFLEKSGCPREVVLKTEEWFNLYTLVFGDACYLAGIKDGVKLAVCLLINS